ncbi:Fumarylacetoacetate (FAA) hydrolase family protein [Ruegeria denitrificans]|uniref:Fumarylacetoacetate (FAA) hydrolase family protein n=1 Tax=Ruegeria denitrificans TaxID=1715692 RepID=A0A0P1IR83_9RHOB|nr:fumarylacetoacetate hydrolase family protein [Ruegeria denitrificans]CUJ97203.1 Fumarylacetoacetate (FAA) hydrolase family protein [Ruegeria denitrificans]
MKFPELDTSGLWLGRVERPGIGPSVVTLRDDQLFDITSKTAPTVRDVLERDDALSYTRTASGEVLGHLSDGHQWLAPCDLQAIKACGVTFAGSMVERVIEEQAAGDPGRADAIRARIGARIGDSLTDIVPGSDAAMHVKEALISEGLWSQYLEVGIGPDAEVFSKAQVLSSVGFGADVGLHPISTWNNPEPEVVLAVTSQGQIKGATLGNDVNLRDVEGRSALLLSKAKDNNASCAIGPMIRLFDEQFTLDTVRSADLSLTVTGPDGFELTGHSSMAQISRDPLDLVAQTIGRHHQYPDGLMLFLGTLFAPTQDRDTPGGGFTHKLGDIVTISNEKLGALTNRVRLSTDCPEWTFGASHLMRNLAARGLI